MNEAQRCNIINEICTIYKFSLKKRKELQTYSNLRLWAFYAQMKRCGLLSDKFNISKVHIKVLLNQYDANHYIIDMHQNQINIYIGKVDKKANEFGNIKKCQRGYIKLDPDWIIRDINIYGESIKRYNGLQLIIKGVK